MKIIRIPLTYFKQDRCVSKMQHWPYNLFPTAMIISKSELFPIVTWGGGGEGRLHPPNPPWSFLPIGFCLCPLCPPHPTHSPAHSSQPFFWAKDIRWWIKMIPAQSLKAFCIKFNTYKGNDFPKTETLRKQQDCIQVSFHGAPGRASHMTMWGHRSLLSQTLTPTCEHPFPVCHCSSGALSLSLGDLILLWLPHHLCFRPDLSQSFRQGSQLWGHSDYHV